MKPEIIFLIQSHQGLQKQKKSHPKKYTPKNFYSMEQSIKHVLSNKSDFRSNTLLCYLSTCYRRPLSTINMIVPSLLLSENKTIWILRILRVCTFHKNIITIDHKADHMKNNLNYFQTKINVTKVGTKKKMESGLHTSLYFFLTFYDKCFGLAIMLF